MCGWKEGAGHHHHYHHHYYHHHHHHHNPPHHHHIHYHHHHDEIEGGVRGWRYGEFPSKGIATASRKGRGENSFKKKIGRNLKEKIGK